MKKFLGANLIIFLMLLLQACVPAAFVAGAAAGGAVIYDNRSLQTIIEDRDITYQAQNNINRNAELRNKTHISVATFNHIVLMVGQAPTPELRDDAISLVQQVPKVKRIYNEVKIAGPISTLARSNDTWLTTKVKAALLAERGLHSTQIKIVTENGTVYLMGLITRSQGELAAQATRKVNGVREVVKVFEYLS